jgi:hypothetical protein
MTRQVLLDDAVACAVEQATASLRAELAETREQLAGKEDIIVRQAEELGALRDRLLFLEEETQQRSRAYFATLLREIHASVLAEDRARRPWWAVWRQR